MQKEQRCARCNSTKQMHDKYQNLGGIYFVIPKNIEVSFYHESDVVVSEDIPYDVMLCRYMV